MRSFTRQVRWLAPLVLGTAVLAGCKSMSCNAPPDYGNADSIPPLNVPTGLDAPDTRNALKVPELNTPNRPRTDAEGCLDAPPSYFPERSRGDFPKGDHPQGPAPSAAPFKSQAPTPPVNAPLPTETAPESAQRPAPLPEPAPQSETPPQSQPEPAPQPEAPTQSPPEATPQSETPPQSQPEAPPQPEQPPGQS